MEAGQGPADREGTTWSMKLQPDGYGMCVEQQDGWYPHQCLVSTLMAQLIPCYLGICFSYPTPLLVSVSSTKEPAMEKRANRGAATEGRGNGGVAMGGKG